MENLLFDELSEHRPQDTVSDGFQTQFIENLHHFGLVVMATHGTPTIVLVPRADTLTMENVPTRESV
jgi:TolB-like protein